MQAQVVVLPGNHFCVIDPLDNWHEGHAVDLKKREVIYYNGDYDQMRPKHIKRLIADHHELGWVSTHDGFGNIKTIKIADARMLLLERIIMYDGVCDFDNKKIQDKYIITLQI